MLLVPDALLFQHNLAILSPGVATLFTPEELGWRLITAPCLQEPPECRVVTTLGAFDVCSGHGLNFFLPVADYFYF